MKNINLPILPQSRTSQRTSGGIEHSRVLASNDYEETQNTGPLSETQKQVSTKNKMQSYRGSLNNQNETSDLYNKIAENVKREEATAIDIYDPTLTMKEIKTIR